KANRDNAYLIDRAVQKTETFTGIDGINVQDRAIQESMGPICDRSQEHLGPADKGIIQMRRLLREAISTVRAGGTPSVSRRATTISAVPCRYCRARRTGVKSSRPTSHRRRYCKRCDGSCPADALGIARVRALGHRIPDLEVNVWRVPIMAANVVDIK